MHGERAALRTLGAAAQCTGRRPHGRALSSGRASTTPRRAPQGPTDMFAAASLLADLFPPEWPPAGAARRGAAPHAPPAAVRLRAALARSFEPSAADFARLVAAGVASESALLRAALVRLAARAAGAPAGSPAAGLFACCVPPLQCSRRPLAVRVHLVYSGLLRGRARGRAGLRAAPPRRIRRPARGGPQSAGRPDAPGRCGAQAWAAAWACS